MGSNQLLLLRSEGYEHSMVSTIHLNFVSSAAQKFESKNQFFDGSYFKL
jgi:hypothetical protein